MSRRGAFLRPTKNQQNPWNQPGLPHNLHRSRPGLSKLAELFGIDLRSLALFRIVLGFIVLIDLAERVVNLTAHYTDAGVLPRGTVISTLNPWRWSINLANGTTEFQMILFVAATAAAILLILGVRTRTMCAILWVLVFSIQARNPLLSSGADTLIRMLLFWSMFLPLGAAWSMDARQANDETLSPRPAFALSFGSAGLLLQIVFMYLFTALLKTGPAWTTEGTAVYYATGAGHVTRPFAEVIHQLPPMLLKVMTYATLVLEFAAPVLLFSPIRTAVVRTFAAGAVMLLHVGIAMVMDIGVFSWASALSMVCFLPARFWDVWLPTTRARLDGKLRVPSNGPLRPVIESITRVIRSFAVASPRPAVAGADHEDSDIPEAPQVASSAQSGLEKFTPGYLRASLVGNVLAALCIVFVLLWNITTVSAFTLPSVIRPIGYATGMHQTWNMFAPQPPRVTQWYVVRGVLMNGEEVDLLRPIVDGQIGQVTFLSWERPDNIVNGHYQDKYWRKYFDAIGTSGRSAERQRLGDYACRMWNRYYGGNVELEQVEIYRMTQRTLPEGERGEIDKHLVDDFACL